jgi:hypothetical protein
VKVKGDRRTEWEGSEVCIEDSVDSIGSTCFDDLKEALSSENINEEQKRTGAAYWLPDLRTWFLAGFPS